MRLTKRCPWCGEPLLRKKREIHSGSIYCKSCGKWSFPYNYVCYRIVCIALAILSLLVLLLELSIPIALLICGILLLIAIYLDSMPLKRIAGYESDWKLNLKEASLGEFAVIWYQNKFRIFGLWSNAILFLGSLDHEKQLDSRMYCVRVTKKKHQYEITSMDERIELLQIKALLEHGSVTIFNEKKAVGIIE